MSDTAEDFIRREVGRFLRVDYRGKPWQVHVCLVPPQAHAREIRHDSVHERTDRADTGHGIPISGCPQTSTRIRLRPMREDAALSHRNACPFGTLGLTPPSRRWTSKTSVRGFERSWPQGRFRPTRTRAWRALRCNTEPYLMSAAWFVRKPHRTSCTRFGRASWFVSTPPAMRCGVRNVCRPERPNGPTYRGDALGVRIHPRSVGNPTLTR